GAMLSVALIVSTLTSRVRQQAVSATDREARTHLLYRFTQAVASEANWQESGRSAVTIAEEAFHANTALLLPDANGKVKMHVSSGAFNVSTTELGIAQWVFEHGQKAGRGTDTLAG